MITDPTTLWLHLVTGDPAYLDCLPLDACDRWCELSLAYPRQVLVIDSDGDVYGQESLLTQPYDAQPVLVGNEVQPCTPKIASYLARRRERQERASPYD